MVSISNKTFQNKYTYFRFYLHTIIGVYIFYLNIHIYAVETIKNIINKFVLVMIYDSDRYYQYELTIFVNKARINKHNKTLRTYYHS